MPLGQGRLVAGRHLLVEQIGRGGMGTVWHAHDQVLDREVALKEVAIPFGLSDEERETAFRRAFREARAAARLRHPNIVTIFDVVEDGGSPWIVMDLVRARSLEAVVRAEGPIDERRAAHIGLRILDALRVAHAAGVVHRDVKPANVLVADNGEVVLTDFGIALTAGETVLTRSGTLVGSPAYIAPERLQGGAATPSGDLWSLGATLFTAVEGVPPYNRAEPLAVLGAVLTQEPDPVRRARALAPVISGLLVKDPARRMPAAVCADMLAAATRPPAPPAASAPRATAGPARRTTSAPPVRHSIAGAAPEPRPIAGAAPAGRSVEAPATILMGEPVKAAKSARSWRAGAALLGGGAVGAVLLAAFERPVQAGILALACGLTWAWLPALERRRGRR